jgi:hypothetical protein
VKRIHVAAGLDIEGVEVSAVRARAVEELVLRLVGQPLLERITAPASR